MERLSSIQALKYCSLLLFYVGFSEGMLEKRIEMLRNNSVKSGLSSEEKNRAKLCVIYIFSFKFV